MLVYEMLTKLIISMNFDNTKNLFGCCFKNTKYRDSKHKFSIYISLSKIFNSFKVFNEICPF
jgi:hypothetical protein